MTEQEIRVLMDLHKKGILTEEALAMALNTAAENVNVQEIDEDIVANYEEGQRTVVQNARNQAQTVRERQAERDKERLEMESARRRQEELDKISQEKEDELNEKIEYLSKLRNKSGELIYSGLEEERNAIASPKEYYEFIDEINKAYGQYKEHPEFIDEINKEYEKQAKQEQERKEVKSIDTLKDKDIIDSDIEIESNDPLQSIEEQNQIEMNQIANAMQELNAEQQADVAVTPAAGTDEEPQIAQDADLNNTQYVDMGNQTPQEPISFEVTGDEHSQEPEEEQNQEPRDLAGVVPDKGRQAPKRISTALEKLKAIMDSKPVVTKSVIAIGAITAGAAIVGVGPAILVGGVAAAGWAINQISKGAAASGGKSK